MPASPSAVARYTSDGVLITKRNEALKKADPNAIDQKDSERESFFDDPAHGLLMANELFAFLSAINRPHEAVAVAENIGLGTTHPIFPVAPRVRIQDDTRGLKGVAIVRAYSFDMGEDNYAVELVGDVVGDSLATMDMTGITHDSTTHTHDEAGGGGAMPPWLPPYESEDDDFASAKTGFDSEAVTWDISE